MCIKLVPPLTHKLTDIDSCTYLSLATQTQSISDVTDVCSNVRHVVASILTTLLFLFILPLPHVTVTAHFFFLLSLWILIFILVLNIGRGDQQSIDD